jgi:perosamine synthetase
MDYRTASPASAEMIRDQRIKDEDFQTIRHLIPRPEPKLGTGPGGQDMRQSIPVADVVLDGNELQYLTRCVQANWISSGGPFVPEFERQFARAMGCDFGIACSSGTVALHLALAALGIGSGDEVIIPAFTMIATVNAVSYTGATAVLVDSHPESWNMDESLIEAKITDRTRAIIVVHTYGNPAEMDRITELARRHKLYVIEDAAEAHGAQYHGRPAGSLSDVACFSFYANKIIATGEGGMLTTNNPEIAGVARNLKDHAFSDERHFWHQRLGFNYRMTNLQAAVGLAQTERLAKLIEKRVSSAARYRQLLGAVSGLTLPPDRPGVKNVFWMFGLLVQPEFGLSRDDLRLFLANNGIETRTFFIPIHLQPIYFDTYRGQGYPVAESLCQKGMYLPSGPGLTDAEIRYISETISSAKH